VTKKGDHLAVATSIINRAVAKLPGFEALLYRFKRNISVLGKSEVSDHRRATPFKSKTIEDELSFSMYTSSSWGQKPSKSNFVFL
jgi:hypothetical protein